MNTYFINELDKNLTYLELRLCLKFGCMECFKKVNDILEFLNRNCFLASLITIYDTTLSADSFVEREDVMSLTIDMVDGKMRFKYWNGSQAFWSFNTQSLCDNLLQQREEYAKIYAKYYPVTMAIKKTENDYSTSIRRVSYTYHPLEDIEMKYLITFSKSVQKTHAENDLLSIINHRITALGKKITDDLKFSIDFDFDSGECIPCKEKEKKT